MEHSKRWAQKLGASAGAKAVETPRHHTPDLLKRIWNLNLETPRWLKAADLWPCVEACEVWASDDKITDHTILECAADLLLERTSTNARRYLRACASALQKERR